MNAVPLDSSQISDQSLHYLKEKLHFPAEIRDTDISKKKFQSMRFLRLKSHLKVKFTYEKRPLHFYTSINSEQILSVRSLYESLAKLEGMLEEEIPIAQPSDSVAKTKVIVELKNSALLARRMQSKNPVFHNDEVIAHRNSLYQHPKAAKRSLQPQAVVLRKQQRFERAMTFRRRSVLSEWEDLDTLYPEIYTVSDLPAVVQAVQEGTSEKLLFAAFVVRKVLYADKPPPLQKIYEAGVLDHVPRWIIRCDLYQLQYEALRIANAVADSSIRYTDSMVKCGLLQSLASAVESPNEDIRVEALAALANTASVCGAAADLLAEYCTVLRVMQTCQSYSGRNTVKVTCWLFSTIARGRSLEHIYQFALPFVVSQLKSDEDVEVLADCCHVLSCLSAHGISHILEAVPRLVSLLDSSEYGVQLEALRALGNFSSGSDEQMDTLLTPGLMERLGRMVDAKKKTLRKEAVWILSNICAGPREHIKAVIDLGVVPRIVAMIDRADLDVCKEACWVVYNITINGAQDQVQVLLDTPVIFNLCQVLHESCSIVLRIALRALRALLVHAQQRFTSCDRINPIKEQISACRTVAYIEDLQADSDAEVRDTACSLMRDFFDDFDFDTATLSDDENTLI